MTKLLAILILLSITFNSYAQTDSCGTPDADSAILTNLPWFGNNNYLTNLRDSLHNANSCTNCKFDYEGGVGNYIYQIPVRVILYYDATHRALNDDEVQWYINAVNQIYKSNGFKVQLYLDNCSIHRKYSSIYTYADDWAEMYSTALNLEREYNKLNITLVHGWRTGNGIGPYPWLQDKYGSVVIANGTNPFTDIDNATNIASSIAHEIGHTLGLLHTFHRNGCRTNCFQECVSRTRTQEWYCFFTSGKLKCSVNGDLLCDTDADPSDLKGVAWDCNSYTITNQTEAADACAITDNYGSPWLQTPNNNALNNLMTYQFYSNVVCNQITPMQQGVMYYYINKANNSMKYNPDVDSYENDNFYQTRPYAVASNCNIANINSKQYHAFHHSKGSACDVDWVYFTNSSLQARPFIIQTSEVSGKPKPDTKITLYSINSDGTLGSQIAFNDNISSTNLFSIITTGNLASSGNFALKIENNISNVSDARSKGHYYLRIDACYDKTNVAIVGDNAICTSKQYSVSNIPQGAIVTWSANPSIYTSINVTNNVATITKLSNGKATIKAMVTYCGEAFEIIKENVIVGMPYVQYDINGCAYPEAQIAADLDGDPCNAQCYSVSQSVLWCPAPIKNATTMTWQKSWSLPANYNFWSAAGDYISILFKAPNQQVVLKQTASNACGALEYYYCFYSTATPCTTSTMRQAQNIRLKIFPNPVSSNHSITLELYSEDDGVLDFNETRILLTDETNNTILDELGSNGVREVLPLKNIKSGKYYVSIIGTFGIVTEELIIN